MVQEDLKRNVFVGYSHCDYVDGSQNVIPGNCVSKTLVTFERNKITYWIDKEGISSRQNPQTSRNELSIRHITTYLFDNQIYSYDI